MLLELLPAKKTRFSTTAYYGFYMTLRRMYTWYSCYVSLAGTESESAMKLRGGCIVCALYAGLFTVIRPYTVRFSEIENPTVRFGAVLRKRKSYGAVRCGFQIL